MIHTVAAVVGIIPDKAAKLTLHWLGNTTATLLATTKSPGRDAGLSLVT